MICGGLSGGGGLSGSGVRRGAVREVIGGVVRGSGVRRDKGYLFEERWGEGSCEGSGEGSG